MTGQIEFCWPQFRLIYFPTSGQTIGIFPDNISYTSRPSKGDISTAHRLGTTPHLAHFERALLAHLLALWAGHLFSAVTAHRAAGTLQMEEEAEETRQITAWQDYVHGHLDFYNQRLALEPLIGKINIQQARREVLFYLRAVQVEPVISLASMAWTEV